MVYRSPTSWRFTGRLTLLDGRGLEEEEDKWLENEDWETERRVLRNSGCRALSGIRADLRAVFITLPSLHPIQNTSRFSGSGAFSVQI